MSPSYRQVYVQCPFYVTDDGKQRITCEGFGTSRSLTQVYRFKAEYERQMESFCCENYQCCEVYRVLMKSKYDKEE